MWLLEKAGKLERSGAFYRRASFPAFSNGRISDMIHRAMLDLLLQFVLELCRTLLIDEISPHVRKRAKGLITGLRGRVPGRRDRGPDSGSPQVTHRK